MKNTYYKGFDVAKIISALLVVCIHTAPLISYNEEANFILVQIIARIAVPLFFTISAYLFFSKLTYDVQENRKKLKKYVIRLLKIYGIWTILYLPFNYLLVKDSFTMHTILSYIRNILFTGSYYHLWFLPALIFAIVVVYFLLEKIDIQKVMKISLGLYLIGMLGNNYKILMDSIPVISNILSIYLKIFETTRNGLFFGMMFISLGAFLASQTSKNINMKRSILLCTLSIILLFMEAYIQKQAGWMHDLSSMYVALILVIYYLMHILIHMKGAYRKGYEVIRSMSFIIYLIHLMVIVMISYIAPSISSGIFYVIVVLVSSGFSYLLYEGSKYIPILKHLYA